MSHYGYLEHSELYHHGVKGMKWGVRKAKDAWQKHWRKKAARYTRIKDFRNSATNRKAELQKKWVDYDAGVYTGRIKDDKQTYRANKRKYRTALREANRDINNMASPWLFAAQKENYINASPKGRRALNALHTAQSVAEVHALASGIAGAGKAINKKRQIRKAEKQYNLR